MDATTPDGEDAKASTFGAAAANGAALFVVLAVGTGFGMLVAQRHTNFGRYNRGIEGGGIEDLLATGAFLAGRGLSALLFTAAGWFILQHRPRLVLGWLALAAGVANALALLASQVVVRSQFGGHHLPGVAWALWVLSWTLAVEPVVLAAILVMFPDGIWPRGPLRWISVLSVGLCCAGLLHSLVSPFSPDPMGPLASMRNPLNLSVLPGLNDSVLIFPGLILANGILVVRWLKARGELRLVLRSLAVVTVVVTVAGPILGLVPGADALSTVVLLVVVIGAVLRHRVYGVEVVLNRTLVYALLSVVVAAVYAGLVGAVSLLGGQAGITESLVPTMGAAFSLFPARQRVQRLVNRFLYGERDEPYAVVSKVGTQLEAAGSAEHLLPTVLASLVQALRVPYAAVDLHAGAGATLHIEQGTPVVEVERFALVHQGEELGHLVVGRRPGQAMFAPAERRLLEDVARQVAGAAANVLLTNELLRSRERVMNAAEEERRRLRRDLHDGLGPVLTAAATRVDASRNLLRRDADRADGLLAQVRVDLTGALDDLRRLVYALRPPALDQLGFLGAVRAQADRSAIDVALDLPKALPELPPALEVAAYRIVAEAITNVARHAGASSCTVSISCNGRLRIEIQDDGPGRGTWTPGVGLSSMRERTVELGGQWSAGPGAGGGRVVVDLPLRAGDAVISA